MTFLIINKSRIESAQRLDAEYYQLEYFHQQILKNYGNK